MSDENYILLESFQIDDGELDGLSPQECFVLGYELSTISHKAETVPEEFSLTVHSANEKRITAALLKRGRSRIMTWMPNDLSEGWMTLTVLKATLKGGE